MSGLFFTNSSAVYIEITQGSLTAFKYGERLNLPLERLPNGRLSGACKEQLILSLNAFVQRKDWQPRVRAYCAIGARGVSLRRLTLPAVSGDKLDELLRLQIESEFPLPPEQLAWGCRQLDERPRGDGGVAQQSLLVVAVRKEAVEEYAEILTASGTTPVFTLAALARSELCPQQQGSCALLDIGLQESEWISFEHGVPVTVRGLPWGEDNLTGAIAQGLSLSREEAEQLTARFHQRSISDEGLCRRVREAIEAEAGAWADSIRAHWAGGKLYLTGPAASQPDLASLLAHRLGNGVECERLDSASDDSAAIAGLKRSVAREGCPPLTLQVKATSGPRRAGQPAPVKWAIRAAVLLLAVLLLPYAEAILLKPRLSRKVSAIEADRGRLSTIERELSFLQHLKQNQPPHLDALAVFSQSAPRGTRFESVSMNRRGEVSMRGTMQNAQQVSDFRAKLIASGFFSTVTVEEQTPVQNQQKVTVRISAQWKAFGERRAPKIEAKERARSGPSGGTK